MRSQASLSSSSTKILAIKPPFWSLEKYKI